MEMNPVRTIIFLIALFFFVVVARLIRRGKLHEKYAVGWFLLGLGVLLSGTFPHLIDWVALYLHVHYPPILPICIGILVILIQQLQLFIISSRSEAKIKRLTQELAIVRKMLEEKNDADNQM